MRASITWICLAPWQRYSNRPFRPRILRTEPFLASAGGGRRQGSNHVCKAAAMPLHLDSVVLAKNGEVVPCDLASGPWLAQSPRGAYTTARTVGGSRVFELTHHINRLASSVQLMMQADCQEGKPGAEELWAAYQHLTDPQRLRPLVVASLSAAIASYRREEAQALRSPPQEPFVAPALESLLAALPAAAAAAGARAGVVQARGAPCSGQHISPSPAAAMAAAGAAGAAAAAAGAPANLGAVRPQQSGITRAVALVELKLTVLVTWGLQGADVFAHVCALPPRPRPPVKVQVKGAPRSNALAKDSEWVRQRKALEASKPADVNEVLLLEASGQILEGMSSNFFAVVAGEVHTAGEGVLEGTVRTVVLEVARRAGIPVVLQAPSLQDVEQWEGAFVSSTSRLVLPIDELSAPDWDPPLVKRWAKGGVVAQLEQLVLQEIEAHSEALA